MTLHELIEKLEDTDMFIEHYEVKFRCMYPESTLLQIEDITVDKKNRTVYIELETAHYQWNGKDGAKTTE